MDRAKFQQGCEGLCTVGGACYLLGRWLDRTFTPEDCEIRQWEQRGRPFCVIDLNNTAVADTVYTPELRRWAEYGTVVVATRITIYCTREYLELDVPVPKKETDYWVEKFKKLAEEIETFYYKYLHEKIETDHIHAVYREPTPSGFRKLTSLLMRIMSRERPKIEEHLGNPDREYRPVYKKRR